jgi:hypothetical protein
VVQLQNWINNSSLAGNSLRSQSFDPMVLGVLARLETRNMEVEVGWYVKSNKWKEVPLPVWLDKSGGHPSPNRVLNLIEIPWFT